MKHSPDPSSSPRRPLLLLPALACVAVGVAGLRFWHLHNTAPDRRFGAAVAAFEAGDLGEVLVAREAICERDAFQPHQRLLSGMILLRTNHPIEAIREFGYAREHSETRAWAISLSGEALYVSGQLGDAVRILRQAVEEDSQRTDAHRWLAAAYFDLGAMNHAIAHLRIVAEQAPEDPLPHRMRGMIYKDFEEYGKAVSAYQQFLKMSPQHIHAAEVAIELAECQLALRQHKGALETLANCPRGAKQLWLEAECYHALNDDSKALTLVNQSLELDPDLLSAMYLKGVIERQNGDPATAVETLSKAVERYPKEWQARYVLARAYQQIGNEAKAATHLDVMKQLRVKWDRFSKLNTEAIDKPNDAELRYELGTLAAELDKPQLAVSWFQAALALNPAHEAAKEALHKLTSASATPVRVSDSPPLPQDESHVRPTTAADESDRREGDHHAHTKSPKDGD